MSVAIISGSAGLVGSEAARHFAAKGMDVVGADSNMRRQYFGEEASTRWQREHLEVALQPRYRHADLDIRDLAAIETLFIEFGPAISPVVHAAAQPSHDWAARDPHTDFAVNATATLNLLQATRLFAPDAVFKIYEDNTERWLEKVLS